ncbi:amidohydrolase family protein [Escherichia coli]|nr:amidohydrolase family protein [Escherichia coli]
MGLPHLCENKDEIARVKSLYPDHDGYLDVYHQYGLTGKIVSLLTASISKKRVGSSQRNQIQHCFLSDLQPLPRQRLIQLEKAWQKKVKVGMGTDIGAGTTFNMLQTLKKPTRYCNYKAIASRHMKRFTATLGGAKSLGLDDLIGNFYRQRG